MLYLYRVNFQGIYNPIGVFYAIKVLLIHLGRNYFLLFTNVIFIQWNPLITDTLNKERES
jgi:hypothetical protein